jgi:hypothetical protein
MPILVETELWKKSLGSAFDAEDADAFREVLVAALRTFESRAEVLAGEIGRDLPAFTVHDASHAAEVWKLADRIAGSNISLNPVETFVLGGAVLLHDLGLATAAYVNGLDELTKEPRWSDTLASVLRQTKGTEPTAEELAEPDDKVVEMVRRRILRDLHAEHAERLATVRWKDLKGNQYALLEDPDLREALGPLIGQIAHSHWAPVGALGDLFKRTVGAPPKADPEWKVRPLLLACLLRLADASHLDGSRAPRFLRLLREPDEEAAKHWDFQERLAQPLQHEDRFAFSSSNFGPDEAEAWWLCADTLAMVDREFRAVDSLLADRGLPRFAIRGVAGADDLTVLATHIPTEGWTPIDAKVRVSNVVRLVERLGGRELYGARPEIPLRELIQNGADAVRARRELDGLDDNWGSVVISLADSEREGFHWLEVTDSGIGMSREVLTDSLLDFGTSFWESDRVIDELPGLLSSGFRPTGKFGIGFFSVFMWGDDVDVVSRRYDAGRSETHILEFRGGVGKRPLLRTAGPGEELKESGTQVRVLLDEDALWRLGITTGEPNTAALVALCGWIAPALAVDLKVEEDGVLTPAVKANDWITMPFDQLIGRVFRSPLRIYERPQAKEDGPHPQPDPEQLRKAREEEERFEAEFKEKIEAVTSRASLLEDEDGQVVGRLAIGDVFSNSGFTVVGGLRAGELDDVSGILLARPTTASRNGGIPLVPESKLAEWASEQARSIVLRDGDEAMEAAGIIRGCGGDTADLPLAETAEGPASLADLEGWVDARNEIWVVRGSLYQRSEKEGKIDLAEAVVLASWIGGRILLGGVDSEEWPKRSGEGYESIFRPTPFGAVAEVVERRWQVPFADFIASFGQEETKVIGTREGQPVEEDCLVLRRPPGTA